MMTLLALWEAPSRGPSLSDFVLFFPPSFSPIPPPPPVGRELCWIAQELHCDIDPSYCRLLNNWPLLGFILKAARVSLTIALLTVLLSKNRLSSAYCNQGVKYMSRKGGGYFHMALFHCMVRHGTVRFTFGGFSTGYCTWYLILF